MAAGHQKDQAIVRSLEFSVLSPTLWREERGLKFMPPCESLNKKKIPIVWVQGVSRLVNSSCAEDSTPQPHRDRSSHVWDPSGPCPR